MKLGIKINIGQNAPNQWLSALMQALTRILQDHAQQINNITEGQAAAFHSAMSAKPTAGTYAQNDFVPNNNITELGGAGNKYIIVGWRCTVPGTPGTWVDQRALTGN